MTNQTSIAIELAEIRGNALQAIESAASSDDLEEVRIRYLGRKGEITQALSVMGRLSAEERPIVGQLANEAKQALEDALGRRVNELTSADLARQLAEEEIDVTLPAPYPSIGHRHPLLTSLRELINIFVSMGYEVFEGREVESDEYNFTKLNMPPDHPARDMWDTLYLENNTLLRTHTSPAQARIMEGRSKQTPAPPIRVIVPGRCYRNEAEDATHGIQFLQIEGLVVDTDVTLADLKGTLHAFCAAYYGPERRVRFRPSYFPFTEPSAEMDIACGVCNGERCRACGFKGWLELLGSGMVHPNVLKWAGYDPDRYSGFAFGMGPDRFAMQKYGLSELRTFRENDLRFLGQFS